MRALGTQWVSPEPHYVATRTSLELREAATLSLKARTLLGPPNLHSPCLPKGSSSKPGKCTDFQNEEEEAHCFPADALRLKPTKWHQREKLPTTLCMVPLWPSSPSSAPAYLAVVQPPLSSSIRAAQGCKNTRDPVATHGQRRCQLPGL